MNDKRKVEFTKGKKELTKPEKLRLYKSNTEKALQLEKKIGKDLLFSNILTLTDQQEIAKTLNFLGTLYEETVKEISAKYRNFDDNLPIEEDGG